MVFGKGGYLAAKERWFWDDKKLEVVNTYKYLGLIFFCWTQFLLQQWKTLRSEQKKGSTEILRTLKKIGCNSPVIFSNFLMHRLRQHCCMQLRFGV